MVADGGRSVNDRTSIYFSCVEQRVVSELRFRMAEESLHRLQRSFHGCRVFVDDHQIGFGWTLRDTFAGFPFFVGWNRDAEGFGERGLRHVQVLADFAHTIAAGENIALQR